MSESLLDRIDAATGGPERAVAGAGLTNYPPPERWADWVEYDARAWRHGEKKARRFSLIPTTCFNCEACCGLLAYVDKDTGEIRRLEGNPEHPASRGRNCAKGPATLNQVYDPERILYPLRRSGARGSGKWERITWDDALVEIGGRVGRAFREGRHNEVMYHVGRPGDDSYIERVLHAWGIDGHNSHTNICSSGARVGYATWMGFDRPSSDFANAKVIFLISSHLEAGHYFNPHAQRIIEGRLRGAKIVCVDPRLSNTASMADHWLPVWPGTEPVLLLAIARLLLEHGTWDREFVRRWVNWEDLLAHLRPDLQPAFEHVGPVLLDLYEEYTPEEAARLCGVDADRIREVARLVGTAQGQLATHNWRAAAAGNEGGWQTARCLFLLNVLTGSVGTPGGTSPNGWDKFIPVPPKAVHPQGRWNELTWPIEYPLSHHELSFLLPHFLKDGRGRIDTYFSRVYNPVWTNPDGFSWLEVLTDEDLVGCHVALTPTWSETAWFADYVLPMGLAPERHDVASFETHAGRWIGFRQPVFRVFADQQGRPVKRTYEANPGEVWEENEFWIDLSFHIDPDGDLGIRQHFESIEHPGQPITVDEYYEHLFSHSIPGLPERAGAEGLSPLQYMRRYGAFEIPGDVYRVHEREVDPATLAGAVRDERGVYRVPGTAGSYERLEDIAGHMPFIGDGSLGVEIDGVVRFGFPTPSRKLELWSQTLVDWGWPEYATPTWIRSHVHWEDLDLDGGERILVPTFRIPTLVHTRSGNAKWLNEISHRHPLWIHPSDADALGIDSGGLVRVSTRIGHFVIAAWRTEGIRPGVVAASHHMGRWRLQEGSGMERWSSGVASIEGDRGRGWHLRPEHGVRPFESGDPDSSRIWWTDAGVHQNLAFPVQPDPVSGMHCWLQRVRLAPAGPNDRYGDVVVDTLAAHAAYRDWLHKARPGPGPGDLRRPLWMARPVKPQATAYHWAGHR
ncbi:MAG TPA: molybdopterin dinucleotide binding domain-containing protein [Acidimicrobiales bacterium]|nr:molybdopterin dinucleotide binding domain-containing protein [Acidimicrobiales bacterium]